MAPGSRAPWPDPRLSAPPKQSGAPCQFDAPVLAAWAGGGRGGCGVQVRAAGALVMARAHTGGQQQTPRLGRGRRNGGVRPAEMYVRRCFGIGVGHFERRDRRGHRCGGAQASPRLSRRTAALAFRVATGSGRDLGGSPRCTFLTARGEPDAGDRGGPGALRHHLTRPVFALAALGGDPQLELDVVKTQAGTGMAGNFVLGNTAADANDHGGDEDGLKIPAIINANRSH